MCERELTCAHKCCTTRAHARCTLAVKGLGERLQRERERAQGLIFMQPINDKTNVSASFRPHPATRLQRMPPLRQIHACLVAEEPMGHIRLPAARLDLPARAVAQTGWPLLSPCSSKVIGALARDKRPWSSRRTRAADAVGRICMMPLAEEETRAVGAAGAGGGAV